MYRYAHDHSSHDFFNLGMNRTDLPIFGSVPLINGNNSKVATFPKFKTFFLWVVGLQKYFPHQLFIIKSIFDEGVGVGCISLQINISHSSSW